MFVDSIFQSKSATPYYSTKLGSAYLGNSLELMANLSNESIDLICTSPPFALVRKKEYGNVDAHEYVAWFKKFACEFYRILKPEGSLVIDIGGAWLKGFPVRSMYHFELVIELCKPKSEGGLGFFLAQELFWYNPAKLPTPAEWVTVRRERVKDAVNTVWWLSKDPHPKANNKRVLRPYSEAMKNLLKNGYDAKLRPSGHDISTKFQNDRGGAIPPNLINDSESGLLVGQPILGEFNWILENDLAQPVNVISASNTASNDYYQRRCKEEGAKAHPARFPQALPEFVIGLCTEPGDLVLDPFAGSNMTGRVAETLDRRWLAFELDENYINASKFRFEENSPLVVTPLRDKKFLNEKAFSLVPNCIKTVAKAEDSSNLKQLNLFSMEGNDMTHQQLKFTYGHQFVPKTMDLVALIQLCVTCQPDRRVLQDEIAKIYYSSHSNKNESQKGENRNKLAMNTFLSIRAYKLVESMNDNDWRYQITDIANEILDNQDDGNKTATIFARHILTNLTGMSLLKAIETINSRGDQPELELIGYELQEMGYSLSPNAIYVSTMRQWLQEAGVFEKTYEINWDRVYDILEIDKDYIDEIYTLTSEQKYFLLAMLHMSITELTKWNKVAKYAESVYKVRFPLKSFVKDIIQPLVEAGLIETEKTTGGRGAKPNLIKLTEKAEQQLLSKLLESIADITEISQTELNQSFEDVVSNLDNPDKHIKGKALELLAIWMIRLTSLRFTKWRKRDYETGQGEVDVLAASDRFVYHRWQIQCKNTKRVDVEVLAKEIGMTFVTGADVVMIVTTGEFTRDAFQYAYRMMELSRYYMVLIQKEDIELIKEDKTNIIKILDRRARRVFAKKELGLIDDEVDEVEIEEDSLTTFEPSLDEE